MSSATATKRRGRKPRGGIANLDDILAYPTSSTTSANSFMDTTTVSDPFKSLAPISIPYVPQTPLTHSTDEVHMHHIDYPWHEEGPNVITPHEFHIRNASSTGPPTSNQKKCIARDDVNVDDEDMDELDVFPNEDLIDYETVFRTQTGSGSNKTLHMSARDREAVEVFRPQQVGGSSDEFTHQSNVPEHMRIISLPQLQQLQQQQQQTLQEKTCTQTVEHTPVSEFYHPFRIHFQAPEQHHCLDDGISWPSKSPFACWWCKHTFDGYPKVSPVSVRGNDIEVVGNFCSWNCSKAWTLQCLKRLDMFNTLYHILFGMSSNEINPSPTYLAIDTFGGPYTIEAYRAGLNNPERQLRFETFSNVQIMVSKMFIRS